MKVRWEYDPHHVEQEKDVPNHQPLHERIVARCCENRVKTSEGGREGGRERERERESEREREREL